VAYKLTSRPVEEIALSVAFVGLVVTYGFWGWSNEITELGGDSSMYVLMARHYSSFHAVNPALDNFVRNATYPPLFPLIIALLGGGFLAAHLVVVASLLGAILCLYLWLREEGVGRAVSAGVCAVFALMPGTYLLALNIWSENTYLCLSLLAILGMSRALNRQENPAYFWWIAVIGCAAAPMVRVAGAPLLATFAILAAINRPRHWMLMIVSSGAPFLAWAAWSRAGGTGISHYLDQWANTYSQHVIDRLNSQITEEARAIVGAWFHCWLGDSAPDMLFYIVGVFGGLCIAGLVLRLIRGRFDAIYVVLYGIMLLAWPWPGESPRLSYVLIPVLLAHGVLGIHHLLSRRAIVDEGVAERFVLAILSLVILPSLLLTASRRFEPIAPELASVSHMEAWYGDDRAQAMWLSRAYVRILSDLTHVGDRVPQGECVFSVKPSVVMLLSGRPSYVPPASSASDADFLLGMEKCRYAYLIAPTSPSFKEPLYPLDRLRKQPRGISVLLDHEGKRAYVLAMLVELADKPADDK
jgi:hypothetical protein